VADAAALGGLTVLIPCGVTQAMMAGAMALGTPIAGALLMAAFTLGTWPVFFGLAYGASSLGAHARSSGSVMQCVRHGIEPPEAGVVSRASVFRPRVAEPDKETNHRSIIECRGHEKAPRMRGWKMCSASPADTG